MDLKGKRVLVMGLGLHGGGLGVARWLVKQGAIVTVTDIKNRHELHESLLGLNGLPIEFVLGEHRVSDFTGADLIVRNPGVPRESRFLSAAREQGIPITMEMGLFFEQLPRGAEQVIGITGTKGKTTTTMMVGESLRKENPKTVVAGNLRVSALELLDQIDEQTPVVLELSSFQLEGFDLMRTSPRWAAITNIQPDHLNRYLDMDDYVDAKANIFRYQGISDFCVLNFDNPYLTRLRPRVPSQVIWFSSRRALNQGAWLDRGQIITNVSGDVQPILPVEELGVQGSHNVENALAATALALAWGAKPETVASALHEFKGAPHRLEFLREVDGVNYVNDTTATTPEAVIAALKTFRDRDVLLIAGGADKGLEYDQMAKAIVDRKSPAILLRGSATEKLERSLSNAGGAQLVLGSYERLSEAVERAASVARPGQVVLLSPGAASFGMFANEFERGDCFRKLVNGLEHRNQKEAQE